MTVLFIFLSECLWLRFCGTNRKINKKNILNILKSGKYLLQSQLKRMMLHLQNEILKRLDG